MIDFFKKYLVENYFTEEVSLFDLSFVKTQNGLGYRNKKVVFYVFVKNNSIPSLVIYTVRDQEYSKILSEAITKMKQYDSFAPRVLFEGKDNNLYFAGVEYVGGNKFQLDNHQHWALLEQFLTEQMNKKSGSKTLTEFYNQVRDLLIKAGLSDILSDKAEIPEIPLPLIVQHGDFQDNNMFVVADKLKIIDWDDYGFIDWPLFDWLSLYLKYCRKFGEDEFIQNFWNKFITNFGLQAVPKKVLTDIYYFYDFLRKDRYHYLFERKNHLQALLNNLKEK